MPILTCEEDSILVKWIEECHRNKFLRRKEDVQVSENEFVGTKHSFVDILKSQFQNLRELQMLPLELVKLVSENGLNIFTHI